MENKPNIKIALCLSGKPISSMFCFPYIYDAFINNNYNVDVFIHTWNKCRIIDLYKPIKYQIEEFNQNDLLNFLVNQLTLPKNLLIQGDIQNNLLQFYTNKRAFDLIPDDYDYVIRCRFDVLIQGKFDLSEIISDLENDKYDIFCPDEVFNFGGFQDRIYIGKYKSMKNAINILENVNFIVEKVNKWHPETFLKAQIDSHNIKVFQKDINHRIVRQSKVITNWPENPFNFLDL
jgi:hypothetical protein